MKKATSGNTPSNVLPSCTATKQGRRAKLTVEIRRQDDLGKSLTSREEGRSHRRHGQCVSLVSEGLQGFGPYPGSTPPSLRPAGFVIAAGSAAHYSNTAAHPRGSRRSDTGQVEWARRGVRLERAVARNARRPHPAGREPHLPAPNTRHVLRVQRDGPAEGAAPLRQPPRSSVNWPSRFFFPRSHLARVGAHRTSARGGHRLVRPTCWRQPDRPDPAAPRKPDDQNAPPRRNGSGHGA